MVISKLNNIYQIIYNRYDSKKRNDKEEKYEQWYKEFTINAYQHGYYKKECQRFLNVLQII